MAALEARPFRLLGATACAALAARAARATTAWQTAWLGSSSADAAVEAGPQCEPLAAIPRRASSDDVVFDTARGRLALVQVPSLRASLVGMLSGGRNDRMPADGTAAAGVVDDAIDALAGALAGDAVTRVPSFLSDEAWRKGSGAVAIECRLGAATLGVLADGPLVRAWLGELGIGLHRPRNPQPLAAPQSGLGREPVEIRVWLGEASLELGALRSLAVGDVILLDSRIDQPLDVTVGGRAVAPRAYLGTSGGARAVRLGPPPGHH